MSCGIGVLLTVAAANHLAELKRQSHELTLKSRALQEGLQQQEGLRAGGKQGGLVHGASDELGYAAVERVCTVHDLHATMLHLLGIRHDAFSVKFQGLDAKLTGVEGARVIEEILA